MQIVQACISCSSFFNSGISSLTLMPSSYKDIIWYWEIKHSFSRFYTVKEYMKPLIRNFLFHPDKKTRAVIVFVYTAIALYANFFMFQVFCVPVTWAAWYCLVFILALLLYPFIKSRIVSCFAAFVLGAGVLPCIYCIVFLSDPWAHFTGYAGLTLWVLFAGIGLLAYLPIYLLVPIMVYFKQGNILCRLCIVAGAVIPLLPLLLYLKSFNAELSRFNSLCQREELFSYRSLPKSQYVEQFLGIGYKYHTRLEYIYDGWRPPVHDPFLNIGLWIYSDTFYPCKNLKRRKYYKLIFPERELQMSCPCSYMNDGMTYFDEKW